MFFGPVRCVQQRLPPGPQCRAGARADRQQRLGGTILLTSALSGVPPFYLTSIRAGLARFDFRGFLRFGTTGRFLRFAVVAPVPLVLMAIL